MSCGQVSLGKFVLLQNQHHRYGLAVNHTAFLEHSKLIFLLIRSISIPPWLSREPYSIPRKATVTHITEVHKMSYRDMFCFPKAPRLCPKISQWNQLRRCQKSSKGPPWSGTTFTPMTMTRRGFSWVHTRAAPQSSSPDWKESSPIPTASSSPTL